MKDDVRQRVKLQFRQYSLDPDFPVFAFMGSNVPWNPARELNEGECIRYMHFHNCVEIVYCYRGSGKLYVEDEQLSYDAGDAVLVLPYSAHITKDTRSDSYSEFLYFDPNALLRKFYPDGLPCMSLFESNSVNLSSVIRGQEHPVVTRRVAEILDELRERRPNYRDCAKVLVMALMMELARVVSEHGAGERGHSLIISIFPAIKFINENYSERIHTERLHELCYLSGTHFRRLFGSVMGCSPLEYIHRLRINRACDLLLSTADSILNISLAVGFDSVSSFNRQFIQVTGISPSKWRRERRQARSELMPISPYDASKR